MQCQKEKKNKLKDKTGSLTAYFVMTRNLSIDIVFGKKKKLKIASLFILHNLPFLELIVKQYFAIACYLFAVLNLKVFVNKT